MHIGGRYTSTYSTCRPKRPCTPWTKTSFTLVIVTQVPSYSSKNSQFQHKTIGVNGFVSNNVITVYVVYAVDAAMKILCKQLYTARRVNHNPHGNFCFKYPKILTQVKNPVFFMSKTWGFRITPK